MKSMTGFGSGTAQTKDLKIDIELSSVNRRNLDIGISLPKDWGSLEKTVSEQLRKNFERGKINAYIKKVQTRENGEFTWDEKDVENLLKKLKTLAKKQGSSFEVTPELLLNIIRTVSRPTELPQPTKVKPVLEKALKAAIVNLTEMRTAEGKSLVKDLKERIKRLKQWLTSIKKCSKNMVPEYREQLLKRLKNSGIDLDLSDERMLKEISFFADRCDISEETIRLESHFKQFLDLLATKGPIGRKMDFLCQEIHRELNTIGSKASLVEITQYILDSKNELERIREQVQNIE